MAYFVLSHSVMSNSLWPHGLYSPPDSFVHGDSPSKNTGLGCHALLPGIFPTQESNPGGFFTVLATREARQKTEHWRSDAFELWGWRRLLSIPCTARRLNQSTLKEINLEYSLEGLNLKLKFHPMLWPPGVKSRLIGKDPDAGKDRRQEDKGTTGDEMVGWHHLHNGHEFEQTLADSEGQGSLICCSPQGHKELDTTEQMNNCKNEPSHGKFSLFLFTCNCTHKTEGMTSYMNVEWHQLDAYLCKHLL